MARNRCAFPRMESDWLEMMTDWAVRVWDLDSAAILHNGKSRMSRLVWGSLVFSRRQSVAAWQSVGEGQEFRGSPGMSREGKDSSRSKDRPVPPRCSSPGRQTTRLRRGKCVGL